MSLAGQKVRAWRKARNPRMTLEDFGRRYRVTGPAVHFWETGARIPSPATIKRLAADGVCAPGDWYTEAQADAAVVPGASTAAAASSAAGAESAA